MLQRQLHKASCAPVLAAPMSPHPPPCIPQIAQLHTLLKANYPLELLPQLATACTEAVAEVVAAFPAGAAGTMADAAGLQYQPAVPDTGLAALAASVAAMQEVTDQQRRRVVRALQRGGTRRRHALRAWEAAVAAATAAGAGRGAGGAGASPDGSPLLRLRAAAEAAAAEGSGPPPASPPHLSPFQSAAFEWQGEAGDLLPLRDEPAAPVPEDSSAGGGHRIRAGAGSLQCRASGHPDEAPGAADGAAGSEGAPGSGGNGEEGCSEGGNAGGAGPLPWLGSLTSSVASLRGSLRLPSLSARRWRGAAAEQLPTHLQRRDGGDGGGTGPEQQLPEPRGLGGMRREPSDYLMFSMSLLEGDIPSQAPGTAQKQPQDPRVGGSDSAGDGRHKLLHEASLGDWLGGGRRVDSSGASTAAVQGDGGEAGVAAGALASRTAGSEVSLAGAAHSSPLKAAAQAARATSRAGLATVISPGLPRPPLPPIATRPRTPGALQHPAAAVAAAAATTNSNDSAAMPPPPTASGQQQQQGSSGASPVSALTVPAQTGSTSPHASTSAPLLLFPDNAQGRLAEVRHKQGGRRCPARPRHRCHSVPCLSSAPSAGRWGDPSAHTPFPSPSRWAASLISALPTPIRLAPFLKQISAGALGQLSGGDGGSGGGAGRDAHGRRDRAGAHALRWWQLGNSWGVVVHDGWLVPHACIFDLKISGKASWWRPCHGKALCCDR